MIGWMMAKHKYRRRKVIKIVNSDLPDGVTLLVSVDGMWAHGGIVEPVSGRWVDVELDNGIGYSADAVAKAMVDLGKAFGKMPYPAAGFNCRCTVEGVGDVVIELEEGEDDVNE